MADANIKKIIIPQSSLPPVSIISSPIATVASATSAISSRTYITAQPHNLIDGDVVEIVDTVPTSYQTTGSVVDVINPTRFSISGPGTGAFVSGGLIKKISPQYVIRYRVISEDRNRVSHWSPQYLVSPKALQLGQYYDIDLTFADSFVSATWEQPDPTSLQSFDIFVAWGSQVGSVGLPEYFATVTGNFAIIPKPATAAASVRVTIQSLSYPKTYSSDLILTESAIESIP